MIPKKRNVTENKSRYKEKLRSIQEQLKKGVVPPELPRIVLLQEMKYDLADPEVDLLFENIDDDTFSYIISNPIVSDYKLLSKYEVYLNGEDIRKELNWITRFLVDYSEEINKFLDLENEYERFLLLGNYDESLKLLTSIEDGITKSAWGMQQKLFIAELEKGFVANKDILSSLLSDENVVLTNFLAHYTSIRIEKNISPAQYTTFVDKYIKALGNRKLNNYIFYKVDFLRNFNYSKCLEILVYDATLSIIDRYKAFIQYAKLAFCEYESTQVVKIAVRQSLNKVKGIIDDSDLDYLCVLENGEIENVDENFIILLDTYTAANYTEALKLARQYIQSKPRCFQSLIIYCKCLCFTNSEHIQFSQNNCLIDNMVEQIFSIYKKDESYSDENYLNLYKIAHFFGNHPLATGILEFLSEVLPYKIHQANQINLHQLGALNSKAANPALFSYISKQFQSRYLDTLDSFNPGSSTIQLVRLLSSITKKFKVKYDSYTLRELKYIAVYLRINEKNYKASLEIYSYIIESNRFLSELAVKHVYCDIIVGKYYCLINLRRLKDALEFATFELIKQPYYNNALYHPKLINDLIESEDENISGNISLSIFLKLYEQVIDFYHIYVAYDNFLCSLNCETPENFFKYFDSKDVLHVTFLEKVCKHEVLHSSPFFNDQEELDLARIEICNFLNVNVENLGYLESEISELLRSVLVRKGIKQIDYSKIYVDVKGLKTIFNKDLKESFNRNIEIASLPVDQLNKIVESVGNLLVYYVDTTAEETNNDKTDVKNLKLTSYNRFIHFKEAFLKIRDSFLESSEHGLDTYLSMRIRHGTLPGQIRSVFESYKLITTWSESEESYLPNEYWLGKLNMLTEENKNKLSQGFNLFSKSIDDIAENLKSQIIQIKTENKLTNGLFDYTYSEHELLELFSSKFGSIRDFDQFVDEVINTLWQKTEECLADIRSHLNNKFVDLIHQLFDKFESAIQEINLNNLYQTQSQQEFLTTIRDCKTAIIVEIQKISEWFKRSDKKFIQDFDFSILLVSSVNTLQRSFGEAKINISNDSVAKLDGDLFPYFTDILFYILHNALKHSRLPLAELIIDIIVKEVQDHITINISNNVFSDPDYISTLEKRISNTKQILRDSKPYGRINKEGGTGFPKIKKTLYHDLGREDYKIDLCLTRNEYDNVIFRTTISFELNDLVKSTL